MHEHVCACHYIEGEPSLPDEVRLVRKREAIRKLRALLIEADAAGEPTASLVREAYDMGYVRGVEVGE